MAAKKSGRSYTDMIEKIVELARQRGRGQRVGREAAKSPFGRRIQTLSFSLHPLNPSASLSK